MDAHRIVQQQIQVVALPSAFTICIQAMNLFMNLVKGESETRKLSSRSELRRFGGHLTIGRERMVEDCSHAFAQYC